MSCRNLFLIVVALCCLSVSCDATDSEGDVVSTSAESDATDQDAILAKNEEPTIQNQALETMSDQPIALNETKAKMEAIEKRLDEFVIDNAKLREEKWQLESDIEQLKASLSQKEILIEAFDDPDRLLALLEETTSELKSAEDDLDIPLTSSGPCGVFRLSGTELLKLRWTNDDRNDFEPRTLSYTHGAVWWEKTGTDIGHEIGGYDIRKQQLRPHLQRNPDTVTAFKVLKDRNHFFHFEWFAMLSDDYKGSKLDTEDALVTDMEGLLGASFYMEAAVLGVDENCNWGLITVPRNGPIFSNSLLTTVRPAYGQDGDWARWFVDFEFKDYGCDARPAPYSSTRYDEKTHSFVKQCPE